MEELYLKLRIELDPNANPHPAIDETCDEVKRLLSIGEEGSGKETSFGIREVTLL
jgi:hypothetical protein